jgi:hypothetical protein
VLNVAGLSFTGVVDLRPNTIRHLRGNFDGGLG